MTGMQAAYPTQTLVIAGMTGAESANSIPVSRSFLCPKTGDARCDANERRINTRKTALFTPSDSILL